MNIRLETEMCQMFNIRYPIVQAGMAGGPTTAQLVAAVSNAGGLGTLGAAYMEPDAIRQAIVEIRQLTDAPFAVNLFADFASDNNGRIEEVQRGLNQIRREIGLPDASAEPVATNNFFAEQIEVLLAAYVPVIGTAFGFLPERYMQAAKSAGLRLVAMVTTIEEAILAEQAGCDAIVAQGGEAGGHRGTFDMEKHPMGASVGTFALIPQVVDRVNIPVIAAGGIMDGRGLVASLALGAQGVQMGTRFLTAVESGAHPAYQQALLDSTEASTVITKAFSGRPARAITNKFIRKWDKQDLSPLPFPTQNTATRDIRNEAAKKSNSEYMSLWAGQGTRLLTEGQHAGDIVAETIRQAKLILG